MKVKFKILNKYLALRTYGNGSPRVVANPFEMVKQECLLIASGRKLPLPRFGYDKFYDEYPDLERWSNGVAGLTREQIEPLDFSKPYDDSLIKELRRSIKEESKKEFNADDLINAELEE